MLLYKLPHLLGLIPKYRPNILVFLQLVISHRNELLTCECEMSSVHHFLCSLPKHIPQTLEQLIEEAHDLFKKYSPQKLENAAKKYLKERYDI